MRDRTSRRRIFLKAQESGQLICFLLSVLVCARSARPGGRSTPRPTEALLHVSLIVLDNRTDLCCHSCATHSPQGQRAKTAFVHGAPERSSTRRRAERRATGACWTGSFTLPISRTDFGSTNKTTPLKWGRPPACTAVSPLSVRRTCFRLSSHNLYYSCRPGTVCIRFCVKATCHWPAAAAPACAVSEPSTNVPEQGWLITPPTTWLFRRPSVFHVISGRRLDRPCRRVLGALHSPVF